MTKIMIKTISLLLSFSIMLSLTGSFLAYASVGLEINISIIRDFGTENEAYIERILHADSFIGAEITMRNTGTQSVTVTPFAVLFFQGVFIDYDFESIKIAPGTEELHRSEFFVSGDFLDYYEIRFFVWDSETMRPLTDAVNVTGRYADFFGNNFNTAVRVSENRWIEGRITSQNAAKFVRFIPQTSGNYTVTAFGAGQLTGTLFNQNGAEITADTGDNHYILNAELTAGQPYYLSVSGSATGNFYVIIQLNDDEERFDIFNFGVYINVFKTRLAGLADVVTENPEHLHFVTEISERLERAFEIDLRLHQMPDFLRDMIELPNYDDLVRAYYATKRVEFEALREEYRDIYHHSLWLLPDLDIFMGQASVEPPQPIRLFIPAMPFNDEPFQPQIEGNYEVTESENDTEEETDEESENENIIEFTEPSLRAEAAIIDGEPAIRVHVNFPESGANGNNISIWNYNLARPLPGMSAPIPNNGWLTNGTYYIRNLMPGGFYIVGASWVGGEPLAPHLNVSLSYQIQLPPFDDQQMVTVLSPQRRIRVTLEAEDRALAGDAFNVWLSRLDMVYDTLQRLTGYTPHGGRPLEIRSTRENWHTETVNDPFVHVVRFGNPAFISRPFFRAHMLRLGDESLDDWGESAIQIISQAFNYYFWWFDSLAINDFLMAYVLETLDATIHQVLGWDPMTGDEIFDFFKSHPNYPTSYVNTFVNPHFPHYSSRGMASILLQMQREMGSWRPFELVFRRFRWLSAEEINYIMPEWYVFNGRAIFNLFMSFLSDFSNVDVFRRLEPYRGIIESEFARRGFGGSIYYVSMVAPVPLNRETSVTLPDGVFALREFTPLTTDDYYIYTDSFGGTGPDNATMIEVFRGTNLTVANRIAQSAGVTPFSRVRVRMTAGQTYTIRISNRNEGMLHADLRITRARVPQRLTVSNALTTHVAAMEYSVFEFEAQFPGVYTFSTSSVLFQNTERDITLELYNRTPMIRSQRLEVSSGTDNPFPHLTRALTRNTTYRLRFMGWLGQSARANVQVRMVPNVNQTGITGISEIVYNGGESPRLGRNSINFTINRVLATRQTFYIVPSLSWDGVNFYDRGGVTVTLSGTATNIDIHNVHLHTMQADALHTRIRVYTSQSHHLVNRNNFLWQSGVARTDVDRGQFGVSGLDLQRRGGGNFIYINSIEKITDLDIIRPRTGDEENRLIFEQSNVTGRNTVYVTHSTAAQPDPTEPFHYDIVLYNPSSQAVTVWVANPFAAVERGWGGYANLRHLYLQRLQQRSSRWASRIPVEIPGGYHRALFNDILPNEFGITQNMTVQPNAPNTYSYIAIWLDFEVQAGRNISVKTLAAYDTAFLNLRRDGGQLMAGVGAGVTPVQLDPTTKIIDRSFLGAQGIIDYEADVHRKKNGIHRGSTDIIDGRLDFIIDNSVANGNLRINLIDRFYGAGNVANENRTSWTTHLNPFADRYSGRIHAMPYNMHRFDYFDYARGGTWRFWFDYLNPAALNSSRRNLIAAPLQSGILNPRISNTFLNHFRNMTRTGAIDFLPFPGNVFDPNNQYEDPYYDYWENVSMVLGSWGVTYEYTINIRNIGTSPRSLQYFLYAVDFFAGTYTVRDNNTDTIIRSGDLAPFSPGNRVWQPIFGNRNGGVPINLPINANYTITVQFLNGVGTVGYANRLQLGWGY